MIEGQVERKLPLLNALSLFLILLKLLFLIPPFIISLFFLHSCSLKLIATHVAFVTELKIWNISYHNQPPISWLLYFISLIFFMYFAKCKQQSCSSLQHDSQCYCVRQVNLALVQKEGIFLGNLCCDFFAFSTSIFWKTNYIHQSQSTSPSNQKLWIKYAFAKVTDFSSISSYENRKNRYLKWAHISQFKVNSIFMA